MATIYPLAMDLSLEFAVIVNVTNDTPYISIGYTQYENYDAEQFTWSNKYNYSYWFPLASFSYTSINDIDSGVTSYASFSGPNVQIQFSAGQIVDLSGNPLDLGQLVILIASAL